MGGTDQSCTDVVQKGTVEIDLWDIATKTCKKYLKKTSGNDVNLLCFFVCLFICQKYVFLCTEIKSTAMVLMNI